MTCSWCTASTPSPAARPAAEAISHGICRPCLRKQMASLAPISTAAAAASAPTAAAA